MYSIECPNCGARELEGACCAYCGTRLLSDTELQEVQYRLARKGPGECKPGDLDYYYHTYRPDRSKAMAALRIDTGISPMEARRKIDEIFDYYGEEES